MSAALSSPADVEAALQDVGYLANAQIAAVVFLAEKLNKPILVEGPAGTGKTELAKALARLKNSRLIRLQCYEGLDESKALYEWDYKKQLLRISAANTTGSADWDTLASDIFSEDFLLPRPLLEAIRSEQPSVLLIDEVDRVELETEALFLEVLSDYQVSIPELGTLVATNRPLVVLTSNNTRDLSEALKRRCLFLHLDYPDVEREIAILRRHVPHLDVQLAEAVAKALAVLRDLHLQKKPSISEGLDWAMTLMALGVEEMSSGRLLADLPVLLKYQSDIDKVYKELSASRRASE